VQPQPDPVQPQPDPVQPDKIDIFALD
jgi:hypothetical protein